MGAPAGKKAAGKKVVSKFVLDCTEPVNDNVLDAASFVSVWRGGRRRAAQGGAGRAGCEAAGLRGGGAWRACARRRRAGRACVRAARGPRRGLVWVAWGGGFRVVKGDSRMTGSQV